MSTKYSELREEIEGLLEDELPEEETPTPENVPDATDPDEESEDG